jgi:hypothetical protein
LLVGGCGDPAPLLDGEYTRAAFHVVARCPDESVRILDFLYPDAAFEFREHAKDRVSVVWGDELLAEGWRDSEGTVELTFARRDPFSGEAGWRFRGRVRDDLRFHERTLAGNVFNGDVTTSAMTCSIVPRSVAWFTTRPRSLLSRDFAPSKDAQAHGEWGRFVWFLDAGPYAMTRKGDPGQRGESLRLFSFAATGGGFVTAGDQAAFVENGFGTWQGAARGRSLVFPQHESQWELDFSQDVVWDDGETGIGIRRVLAGFVTGTYRVNATDYPAGWEGETGLLPLVTPGFSYWLDVDRGAQALHHETVVRSRDREWSP